MKLSSYRFSLFVHESINKSRNRKMEYPFCHLSLSFTWGVFQHLTLKLQNVNENSRFWQLNWTKISRAQSILVKVTRDLNLHRETAHLRDLWQYLWCHWSGRVVFSAQSAVNKRQTKKSRNTKSAVFSLSVTPPSTCNKDNHYCVFITPSHDQSPQFIIYKLFSSTLTFYLYFFFFFFTCMLL